jgi:hypothetical protein
MAGPLSWSQAKVAVDRAIGLEPPTTCFRLDRPPHQETLDVPVGSGESSGPCYDDGIFPPSTSLRHISMVASLAWIARNQRIGLRASLLVLHLTSR